MSGDLYMNELHEALCEICEKQPQKIILSNSRSPLCEWKKTVVRPYSDGYRLERFTEKQAFHEACTANEIVGKLYDLMTESFRQCNAVCLGMDYELKLSKKGKLLKNRRKNDRTADESNRSDDFAGHDRKKHYILSEGIFVPALYELGVMTTDGKIVAAKYDKFKQINRFIECVDDALKKEERETLEIVDFGCGKSYLTFVLYYYLTEIRQKKVHIVGLDLKRDVIEKCTRIAEKYGYDRLEFQCCDIKDYCPQTPPDMVVTLHACDTATDYALYNAIRWQATYIFSVPCCQHELNQTAQCDRLRFMTDYGILRERMCALATDAVRARLLEKSGYQTDVLEFIDYENSPKNLLIRAQRLKKPNVYRQKAAESALADYEALFGTKITLQKLLEESN